MPQSLFDYVKVKVQLPREPVSVVHDSGHGYGAGGHHAHAIDHPPKPNPRPKPPRPKPVLNSNHAHPDPQPGPPSPQEPLSPPSPEPEPVQQQQVKPEPAPAPKPPENKSHEFCYSDIRAITKITQMLDLIKQSGYSAGPKNLDQHYFFSKTDVNYKTMT